MNCPKCNRENDEGAMYCRHCGSPMHSVEKKDSNVSSILIFVWIVSVIILSLINQIIFKLDDGWYYSSMKMVVYGIFIIQNLLHLLPAFAIKNKNLKIIGIVIMSIMVIWWVVQNIQEMIS